MSVAERWRERQKERGVERMPETASRVDRETQEPYKLQAREEPGYKRCQEVRDRAIKTQGHTQRNVGHN